jgi:hypothetical protein
MERLYTYLSIAGVLTIGQLPLDATEIELPSNSTLRFSAENPKIIMDPTIRSAPLSDGSECIQLDGSFQFQGDIGDTTLTTAFKGKIVVESGGQVDFDPQGIPNGISPASLIFGTDGTNATPGVLKKLGRPTTFHGANSLIDLTHAQSVLEFAGALCVGGDFQWSQGKMKFTPTLSDLDRKPLYFEYLGALPTLPVDKIFISLPKDTTLLTVGRKTLNLIQATTLHGTPLSGVLDLSHITGRFPNWFNPSLAFNGNTLQLTIDFARYAFVASDGTHFDTLSDAIAGIQGPITLGKNEDANATTKTFTLSKEIVLGAYSMNAPTIVQDAIQLTIRQVGTDEGKMGGSLTLSSSAVLVAIGENLLGPTFQISNGNSGGTLQLGDGTAGAIVRLNPSQLLSDGGVSPAILLQPHSKLTFASD